MLLQFGISRIINTRSIPGKGYILNDRYRARVLFFLKAQIEQAKIPIDKGFTCHTAHKDNPITKLRNKYNPSF